KMPGGVRMLPYKTGAPAINVPVEQLDPQMFQVRFSNLTVVLDFVFEFTDTDNVLGKRHVELRPIHDTAPEVDVQVEVIRKVNQAYMVTPQALVPFSGKVRDDRGLNAVAYVYTVERVETGAGAQSQLALVVSLTSAGAGERGLPTLLNYLALVRQLDLSAPADEGGKQTRTAALDTFEKLRREQTQQAVSRAKLDELLRQPPVGALLKSFDLDPELEVFSVGKLGLKVADEKAVQPHYRLRLSVSATDNNIETGPGVGQSKEKFTFLIVSENELLAEIAKEEEGLHVKLEEAVNRLKDGKIKLDKVAQELPELKPDEFSP